MKNVGAKTTPPVDFLGLPQVPSAGKGGLSMGWQPHPVENNPPLKNANQNKQHKAYKLCSPS